MIFKRTGDAFSSEFCLNSETPWIFTGISSRLGEKIENWSSTSEDGCGYILDESKDPVMNITNCNQDLVRIVSIGIHGTVPKILKSYEQFTEDMIKLERVVNKLVSCCFEKLRRSDPKRTIPDHSIYVTA